MLERLEHSNLEEITLAKKSVRWYKKGKEIIIGNSLFDVKSSTLKTDSITFTGLFDEKETLLKKNIDLLTEHQNKHSTSDNLSVAQLVFRLWDNINEEYNLLHPVNDPIISKDWRYKENLLIAFISPLSPPPKTV
jgi:hypothetical protein